MFSLKFNSGHSNEHQASPVRVADLDRRSDQLAGESLERSTKKTYASALAHFERLRLSYDGPKELRTVEDWKTFVLRWIAYCSMEGPGQLRADTVPQYLAALRSHLTERGISLPGAADWPELYKVLKGLGKTEEGRKKTQAFVPSMESIKDALLSCPDTLEGHSVRVALLLQCWLLLRPGNIAAAAGRKQPLQWEDIRFGETKVFVNLKWSKRANSAKLYPVPRLDEGDPLCLYAALRTLHDKLGPERTRGTCCVVQREDGVGLGYDRYRRLYRSTMQLSVSDQELASLSGAPVTPHGMRAAGARIAVEAGLDETAIRYWGRWATQESFEIYLRSVNEVRVSQGLRNWLQSGPVVPRPRELPREAVASPE